MKLYGIVIGGKPYVRTQRGNLIALKLLTVERKGGTPTMECRYECELRAGDYRIRVNVFTDDPAKVEQLAREQATKRLNALYGSAATAQPLRYIGHAELPA